MSSGGIVSKDYTITHVTPLPRSSATISTASEVTWSIQFERVRSVLDVPEVEDIQLLQAVCPMFA